MRYTSEEMNEFINEYAERVGTTKEKVQELYSNQSLVVKTGSYGSYLVENPYYLDEYGNFKKTRKKNTHLTPKKKKRKK